MTGARSAWIKWTNTYPKGTASPEGADRFLSSSGLDESLIERFAAEAHEQGLQVWSHAVVWPTKPSRVSAAGVDVLSHAHGLITESQSEIPDDIGVAVRQWLPTQDFSAVDPSTEPFTKLFAQIKDNNQILEPTLFALDDRRQGGSRRPPRAGATADRGQEIDYQGFRRFSCEVTRAAIEAGVAIAAGTDTWGRTLVTEEMLLLANCGAGPLEVISAATHTNARAIGIEDQVGTLAPGMVADFVVLNSDPLTDLSNLKDIYLVVKRGEVVRDSEAGPRAD